MASVNGVTVPRAKVHLCCMLLKQAGVKPVVQYDQDELLDMYTTPGKLQHTLTANGAKADVPTLPRHANPKDFLRGIRAVHADNKGLYPHWR